MYSLQRRIIIMNPVRLKKDMGTGHEAGVPQPDFAADAQPVELLRRIFHEIGPLDVELA